jgi:hypothetical protein
MATYRPTTYRPTGRLSLHSLGMHSLGMHSLGMHFLGMHFLARDSLLFQRLAERRSVFSTFAVVVALTSGVFSSLLATSSR